MHEELDGIFRLYVQGVGTPFSAIGEAEPDPYGASTGAGGGRRIRYAMLFIVNRVAKIIGGHFLVDEDDHSITQAVKDESQLPVWREKLKTMLAPRAGGPTIDEITLDLFGFSRGAAEARSFLNQFLKHFGDGEPQFCGIPVRVRFMGLFDTVAAVGLADSFPLPVTGHQDWGDEALLPIPSCVEQCVHMVASHEVRSSFPVDLVRGPVSYPPNCLEIVYPGMHSDVGGGYSPNDQGKGTQQKDGSVRHSQADKLSQIPLNDMYRRALAAGVPLLRDHEVDDGRFLEDFAIAPELQSHYDAYMAQFPSLEGGAPVTEHFLEHRRHYLSWRRQVLAEEVFTQRPFVLHSSEQERIDLTEANQQLRERIEGLAAQTAKHEFYKEGCYELAAPMERGFYVEWDQAGECTPETAAFLEQYVHDSRAHFVLTDPQSAYDHKKMHEGLKAKDEVYQRELATYRIKQEAEHKELLAGKYIFPSTPPAHPLSDQQRVFLEAYEQGQRPLFNDANPGSSGDAAFDTTDVVYLTTGRREGTSYLLLRQVFAVGRVDYSPTPTPEQCTPLRLP